MFLEDWENLKNRFEKQKNNLNLNIINTLFRLESLYNVLDFTSENRRINKLYFEISKDVFKQNRLTVNDFNRELWIMKG